MLLAALENRWIYETLLKLDFRLTPYSFLISLFSSSVPPLLVEENKAEKSTRGHDPENVARQGEQAKNAGKLTGKESNQTHF